MRRIHKLVSNGSRKIQSLIGEQKSARKSSRRVMNELFMEMAPLEERVLMTTITINSQADLAQYFTSSTNSYSIDAGKDSVTISSGVTINSLNTKSGQAGNITIVGQSILIQANAQILANGATDAQDGSITIQASNVMEGFDLSAVNQAENFVRWFENQSATISVEQGVDIEGGAVNISTISGNEFKASFVSSLILQPLFAVILEAKHTPDFATLPISVQVWQPKSTINLSNDTTIHSSGNVTVTSNATVNAVGKAIWNSYFFQKNGNSQLGGAIGEFYTDANATITVSPNSTIHAAGEVEIKTTVDNVVELESESIKNLGITQTNPKAISLAWGSTQLKTTSIVDLQVNSTINAEGSVIIEAEAVDENAVVAMATAYRDGTVTAGGAFTYSLANVQVFVNGTVTSGVVPESEVDLSPVLFNPDFAVNFNNSSLNFSNPVLYTTGQELVFDSADGSTIPGLKPGSSYFAICNSANPNQLQLAATQADALAGNPISFGIGYPTLTVGNNVLPISVIDSVETNSILFGFNTLPDTDGLPVFQNGQTVTYNPLNGQFIGTSDSNGNYVGALPAGTYKIKIVDSPMPDYFPLAIQLYDVNSNLVNLNTYSQFTVNGNPYLVASFDSSSSQVNFNFSQPTTSDNGPVYLPTPTQTVNLTNGQAITFVSGLGCQVGNLVNGQTYYAVVDSSTPGIIRLATTYAQSVAANPAVQNAIPQLKTVDNQLAIGSFADSFSKINQTSELISQSDNSYKLYNNATGGTFQLTVKGPDGTLTTAALAFDISAADLQTALNSISGVVATVSGNGTQFSPWLIAILFQFNIGNIEPGTGLVFSNNPNLSDGTAVTYLGIAGKPVGGLTSGNTYYAFNSTNPYFETNFPQYVLTFKETSSSSAPDVALELVQTITDANGVTYNFLSSNAQDNQITLNLPSTGAVSSVNGSVLSGGTANYQILSGGAAQFFSFATSGTFTFSVTDAAGNVQTTNNINFNAASATVQAALNALDGVNVVVSGLGTFSSPWTIDGLNNQTLTADSSNLLNDGYATNLLSNDLGSNVQQVWSNATAGTLTISLVVNGKILTTAPIAYNATALQVAQALSALPQVVAAVTGSGTASDPWQFTAVYQSIQTGDALTFNDCWNSYNLGMNNCQTYYAVVSTDQYDPQAVVISLAASYDDAVATVPVLINMQDYLLLTTNQMGVMTGSEMGLDEVHHEESGVTIKAILEANDAASFTSQVGLFPMLAYYTTGLHHGDYTKADRNTAYLSQIETKMQDELPSNWHKDLKNIDGFKYTDDTSVLQTSLAFALLISKNNVQVNIGSTAVIETAGVVTINSEINHVLHTMATASVARTTNAKDVEGELRENSALGVALDLVFVENTCQSVIQSNAQVSGGEGVVLDSVISYPFAWKQTNIAALKNGGLNKNQKAADGTALAENIIKDAFFKNAFGVSNWLFNHSVNSDVMQPDNSVLDWTLAASVSSINIKNTNLAQICDGAQINQSLNVTADANQSVSVIADTDINQLAVTGQMVLGLNLGWLYYVLQTSHPRQNTGYILKLNQGKNTIGGSVNLASMDNSTQALIGGANPGSFANMVENQSEIPTGATQLNFGNGGLTIEAVTNNEYISVAQSGGIATGFGIQASISVIEVNTQNTTAAILAAENPPIIRSNPNTNGNITIEAIDNSILTPSSGGLLLGNSINLGYSGSVAVLNRNVSAYIGQNDPNSNATESTWVDIHSAGEIVIDACATGKIIPVSLAGSVVTRPSDANGTEMSFKDEKFHWGIGVSGDYSEAIIKDNVIAYINGACLTGHENEQLIEISSLNDTRLNIATGAAALQREGSRRSSVGFAGSASYSDYQSNVTSVINNAKITAFSLNIEAQNNKTVGTFAAGLSGSVVGKIGIDVAGSVAINHITNSTVAEIVNTTASELGTVELLALEKDDIWAAAGTITFVTSFGSVLEDPQADKTKIGFGFGFAQNLLDSTTHAMISDSGLVQTAGGLSLEAEQASRSFVLSAGMVFEAGKGTGITPYGMVALNEYTNADVQALVENSSITSTSTDSSAGMLIASQLIPIMITAAGDLGLSIAYKTGPGLGSEVSIGAGVSVTEVSITGNSVASVSNSTITLDQGNLTVNAYTGQAADATNLNNTLTNLNLPPGNYNLYSLAIAGGVTTAISVGDSNAVGVDGVGAGIGSSTSINTLANITDNSQINLLGNNGSGGSQTVEALENLAVYDDAGGASVSIQFALGGIGFGIAVGIGAGVHQSTNHAIASVTDSNVTNAGNITVSAESSSNTTIVGFGVALDVSIADTAVGISASSATTKIVSDNTIASYITGGMIKPTGKLDVCATDNSDYSVIAGSGSLAVSGGENSLALAAGSSVSRIEASHTISSYIGSTNSDSTTITTIIAGGPVQVQATNNQHLTAQTIAVASSIAFGGDASVGVSTVGAGARITTNNNITAGLRYGTSLTSNQASGSTAVTVEAIDQANISSTVGSGAFTFSFSANIFASVGGSIGISISELTNNDNVKALVEGATIATQGGDVVVQAVGNNTHSSESIATSVAVSIWAFAGAGGNSNIYDNANFTASVDSGSSIITGNSATGYGNLSVLAETSEKVTAQMFGGSGSVGSIGVYMSNATRSGSTVANLVTNGTISVSNLTVKATTNQTITSEGMSVTIGVLAGTGETVRLGIDEKVQTNVNGSNNTWNIHGNLSIGAKTTNNATAQASGVSVALGLGVGFFKVDSAVNPVVSTTVSNVNLIVSGTSSMGSLADSTNDATAQSGSGSIVGGEAARAITDNSPTISLSTTNLTLTSRTATFLAQNCGTYSTNADSVYATAVGGSAARAYNTSSPNLTLNLGTGTVITADGSVIVKAENDMVGLGDASNLKTSGIMARVGGGGIAGGFGGTSVSCLTAGSAISLGSNVSISANGRGSKVLIGSSQNWNTNQLTYMHDSSGIGGAGVHSSLTSCLTNNIDLGSNVTLLAPSGSVGIGTSINSQTTADSYSYTFAIFGGSRSVANNTQNACQTVTIGNNSLLKAAGDISVTAGYNPVSGAGSLQDTYAIVTAHCKGLVSIPGTDATATDNSIMNVTIGSGSQIISDRDVDLGAIPGINNAQWYTFANSDGSKGKTNSGKDGVTQTSNVTINGNVIAGYTHQLDINIPQSGTTASVNGQDVNWTNTNGGITNVIPQNGSAFIPFQAAYQTNYNATQLLNGLDETSKLILSKSISTTPVDAITLANLTATGGQVLIHANKSLSGTGTISAFSPNITVINNSPAYLLLDGVGIPNTLNMGKITVVGSAGLPVGMTINQQLAGPSINIKQLYNHAVGTGTTSGPAIAVIDPIVNTGGSVAIYNACGALVQDAAINAMSLSISTPNSAYIVNTPQSYMGTGGSISDYWMNTSTILVQDGGFESPGLGSGSSSYQYNPQGTSWTFTPQSPTPGSGISGNDSGFTSGNPNAPAGGQVGFIQEKGVISQTVSGLIAGRQYTVSFYAAQRKNYPNQSFNVTLGSTTLVSSLTPNSSNYQNYSYTFTPTSSANQTLTFTGLEPSGQDETVFLDQVIVAPTTTTITPGLNSYVYQYTANLAATTAANNLYLEQSKATNSTAFSYWLYNNGANTTTNNGTVLQGAFVNADVSVSNPGTLYPKNAGDNWPTTEYGTGVIFFGSEIPYLWQNGCATIAGDSSYLTGSTLGYLDTLANAQYWSVAASGNPANSGLNVAQGTGPQNDKVNPGRGIYPAVPSNFPTSSSIANPQLATLGNGITAGQLDITALYIDINAPVNLGVNNTGFQANLSAALGTYIQSQLSGNTSCIPIPDSYLGGSNTELTAYYDVLANQIVLSPVAINAGVVSAIFKGGIISTTNQGKITVTSNPGQNLIDNQTGYPLVIQGIEAAESQLAGIVQFNDTLTNLSTAYVYRGNNVVQKYQGPLGPNNGANLSQLQLVSNTSATSATFAPASNLAYQWNQQAFISRNLSFTNDNNSYTLNASGSSGSTSPSAVNDNWSWGQLGSNGSAPLNYNSATNPFQVLNSFELTNGTNNSDFFSGVVSLTSPVTNYTQQISSQITQLETATTYFSSNYQDAWNFGPSTQWTWTYPTEILMQIKNQLPACNPIAIDFSGVQSGSLTVVSNSNMSLAGNIQFPGSVNLGTSGGSISQSSGALITSEQLYMTATGGSVGSSDTPIQINIPATSALSASGDQGVFVNSQGTLTVGSISTSSAATSGFGVNGTGWTQTVSSNVLGSSVINSNIAILTQSGTGSYASSIWYNTPVSTLSPLNIEFVYQASGDKAADGVALVFQNQGLNALGGVGGSLGYVGITGNTAAYQINLYNAGGSHIPGSNFVTTNSSGNYNSIPNINFTSGDQIRVQFSYNPVAMTVTVQLTDLVTLQTNQTVYSNINLSSVVGNNAYAGFTGGDGGDTSTQTISSFSMQSFTAGMISLESGADILALNSNSIVSGTNISLFANNGKIGTQQAPLTIQTQTQQIESGSIVYGTLNASTLSGVFLTQPNGDLRIGSVKTSSPQGMVSITTEHGNITDGNIPDVYGFNTGKLSPVLVHQVMEDLKLRNENAANTTVAAFEGSVDQNYVQYWTLVANQTTSGNLPISNSTLPLSTVSNGVLTLTTNGVKYYQPQANLYYASTDSPTVSSGFANWSGTANNTSANMPDSNNLTLTNGLGNEKNAYWYPQKVSIPLTGNLTILFTYQASGNKAADGLTLAFQNEGLNAIGSSGGGLGYAGITGPTAAYQINLYSGHTSGANFVISNTSGNYSPTGSVHFTSGDPIQVQLVYNADNQTVTATLTDLAHPSLSNVTVYNDINLASLLGDSSYMGFTGGDGGDNSIQTVSNFSLNAANISQVNTYANQLYNNSINCFRNNLAFGPNWATLPQFQAYNANYTYTASNTTVSALTYGAFSVSNSFALLSLDALSPHGTQVLGNTTLPAIQTSFLNLKSSGSIGLSLDPIEIQMDSIQNGTLTPREEALLTMATNAGELQMVGTNAQGQRVVYSYGSEPANITATGVIIKIEKPLFVNLADNGQVHLNAGSSINLTETLGDMNIANISTTGNVRLVAGSSINQVETSTSGSPVVAIRANNLRLTSGDSIGSSTTPIAIQITGKLDSYSTSDLFLNQVSGDLLMGTIKSSRTTQINAQGSLYGTDNTIKGSIGNFGVTGTGWTVNSQNQTAGISQDVLTLGNAGLNGESSVWFNQPTVVVNSFIVSFIYQNQYTGNGLTFCIQSDSRGTSAIGDSGAALGYGTNGVNLQIQPSIAWQLSNGAAPNATQGVGLNRNGGYGMYEQPSTINFNSNDPIQVVLQYSTTTYAFTQTLTDTVTGETYSSTLSADINLYALLGNAKAYLGFTGSGPAQTISNFYFSYGEPTISAGNLTVTSSNGQIGTSTSPIFILASGSVNATAPDGIYLLQTNGDLYVNSISSPANVSLSAPTGSVVNSSSGSVQSSSLRSPSFGIHAASVPATGIKANHLQLNSLYGFGTANQPLTTQVNELTAINQFGDIVINNTGPLAIGNGSPGNAIQTGRSVNITSDSSITVNSSVSATEDIQLRSISGYLGGSRINVNPGVSIASESGGVYLFGGDGVSIVSGASVRSNSVVELYINPIAGVNSTSPSLESRGQIVADNIRFNSSDIGTNLYLALAGIRGVSTSPTVEFNAGSGLDTLTIDNRVDKNGLAVSIADGMIQTPNHKLILNAIDSVILELGDGSDQVKIGDNMPLNQLQIFTNGGADTIETTLSKSTVKHQSFNSGTGLDSIKINGSGQNTWASTGLVQSWERSIQYRSTESISLSSATTVNAMPVATYPAIQQIPTGLDSNSRYIESTYQQILNRLATPRELSRWSSMLDRNTITRLQLANKLTNTDEARLLRINAWFLNYFGRPATKQESKQSLRRIHSGQSETRVLAGLLANQEFFNRTQSLIATGFSRDRFITGLYKLAIDPSGAPSPALYRFLNRTWQTKGRTAVILNVLQSAPIARNQAEGLSILINQAPAQPQAPQVRLGQSRPSGVHALLLSRRSF